MAALIFDLDGVLVDSLKAYRAAWTGWAEANGVSLVDIASDLHGRRPRDVIARVRPDLDLAAAAEAFDTLLDGPSSAVVAMPGAVELTAALSGYPWAIATSGQRRHVERMLAATGISHPPVLVCGDDIDRGKPDPQCFLLAAHRLGAAPQACTVIEDAPAGILAARAAGMHCVAVATTHQAADLAGAGAVFASLSEALPHLLGRARAQAAPDG